MFHLSGSPVIHPMMIMRPQEQILGRLSNRSSFAESAGHARFIVQAEACHTWAEPLPARLRDI